MKKISILGLMISLFAVFAFSSCSKDKEPKKEVLSFVGKTYKVLTTWEGKLIEDESEMKDDDTRRYFIFIFDNKDQLTYKHGTYTPDYKGEKTGEHSGNNVEKYNYTYDEKTRIAKLTKVLSVTTDIERKKNKTSELKKEADEFKEKITLQFDEKFKALSFMVTDKKGKIYTLPLKLQK